MDRVSKNLSDIKREIAPYNPRIIAVTKYFDEKGIVEAFNAGLRDFGENRVQDALEKISKLEEAVKKESRFHLIGHLQSNKVKKAVGNFELIHSVDSLKLAKAISDEALSQGVVQKVLIQVNNACETSKSGFCVEEIKEDFGKILSFKGIEVRGLMNMAPITSNEKELEQLFNEIYELKIYFEKGYKLQNMEISMGMSGDYKTALKCGATMIRLGRKLFS